MNVKLSLAKMVEYVQTLLLTIPVSAQVNSWEEIVNTNARAHWELKVESYQISKSQLHRPTELFLDSRSGTPTMLALIRRGL